MKRIFAIGDIHGCSKTFRKLVEELSLNKQDEIYCIGDYIDRGNDSKGVIDFIIELRNKGYHVYTLRGNHEQMMMDSVVSENDFFRWVRNGGDTTLLSFGVNSYNNLNPVYKDFFSNTVSFIELDRFIFVHAGLNFKNEDLFEDKEAMLWIRDFSINKRKLKNRVIIHGHTPEQYDFIMAQKINIINIDGGCVYNDKEGYGNLFALNVLENKFISQINIDP